MASFLFVFVFSTFNGKYLHYTFFPMTGFKLQTYGNRNWPLCQLSHNHCPKNMHICLDNAWSTLNCLGFWSFFQTKMFHLNRLQSFFCLEIDWQANTMDRHFDAPLTLFHSKFSRDTFIWQKKLSSTKLKPI